MLNQASPARHHDLLHTAKPGQLCHHTRTLDAVGTGTRYGARNRTLLLLMYRPHGLRVSEAIALRWDQLDLKQGLLYVHRRKNGVPSTHPVRGPELKALKQLRRDWPASPYLFICERGGPMTASNVRKLVTRAGIKAKFDFPVQPHMRAPRRRIQARQRGPRYPIVTALPRAQEHRPHGPVYRVGARSVQGLLEGLTRSSRGAFYSWLKGSKRPNGWLSTR
jgi:hypothetical protein